ncbi:unnamed protein product [Diplocarpon coronariae]
MVLGGPVIQTLRCRSTHASKVGLAEPHASQSRTADVERPASRAHLLSNPTCFQTPDPTDPFSAAPKSMLPGDAMPVRPGSRRPLEQYGVWPLLAEALCSHPTPPFELMRRFTPTWAGEA